MLPRRIALCGWLWLQLVQEANAYFKPNVTPSDFSGQVMDMVWRGNDSPPKVVLAGTRDGFLYRSVDGGRNYVDITAHVPGVMWLQKSQANPMVVMALCRQGHTTVYYISNNAGETWRQLKPAPGFVVTTAWLHPRNLNDILMGATQEECASTQNHDVVCSTHLYVSQDVGVMYDLVATHVVQFSWGSSKHSNRIYYTEFIDKTVSQPLLTSWRAGLRLAYTDDFGKHSVSRLDGANRFAISEDVILAAVYEPIPKDSKESSVHLYVSTDAAASFAKAVLAQRMDQRSYTLLDVTDGRIFLHIEHQNRKGDIYVSDMNGSSYTLSLSDNLRQNGACAFQKMVNIRGVFIANVEDSADEDEDKTGSKDIFEHFGGLDTQPMTDRVASWRRLSTDDHEETDSMSSGWKQHDEAQTSLRSGSSRQLLAAGSTVKSVISFNMGGTWKPLLPPPQEAKDCGEECSLHLHDITDFWSFVPVYSYRNAVGVIMGTGNVGKKLEYSRDSVNTYVSRDGGASWKLAAKGTYIYEYGNHGGLLVMADWVKPTKILKYSWDQGDSWTDLTFTQEEVYVSNVIIEPHALSLQFVILARLRTDYKKGRVFHVDFSGTVPACQGLATPGKSSSSYEYWTPKEPCCDGRIKDRCLLGRIVEYTRRKQNAQCYNSRAIEVYPREMKPCECTIEDFECNALHAPAKQHSTSKDEAACKLALEDESQLALLGPCDSHGQTQVMPFRKIANNSCVNGWQPKPQTVPCKGGSSVIAGKSSVSKGGVSFFAWFLKWLLIFCCCCSIPLLACTPLKGKIMDALYPETTFQPLAGGVQMGIGPVRL